jgi:hypothetical protein
LINPSIHPGTWKGAAAAASLACTAGVEATALKQTKNKQRRPDLNPRAAILVSVKLINS